MKKVLTLITTASLAGSLVTAGFAQAAGPKNGGVGQGAGQSLGQGQRSQNRARIGQMQKLNQEILAKLNLNKGQQTKITAAQTKLQNEMKELMAGAREAGDRQALREKAQKLQTEYRETLKNTLTAEQQKKYQELMRAAMEKQRKDGGAGGKAGKGGAAGKAGKAGNAGKGGGGGG